MEFTTPTESLEDFWRSQTTRTPARYQAWSTGKFKSLLGSGASKESLLTPAFLASYAHREIRVLDTQARVPVAKKVDGKIFHLTDRIGAVVARHRMNESLDWVWSFSRDWREKPKPKAKQIPKRVTEMRRQLVAVADALGKPKDATAAFLASEAGLKEHALAKLLDLAASGFVHLAGQAWPLQKVGVRLEKSYLALSGWEVVPA